MAVKVKSKGKGKKPSQDAGGVPRATFPVTLMSPHELKPYFRNNKKHPNSQINELGRVLSEYGFDQPIVVDADMVIIKGHGRYLAALKWVLDEVPVVVRDDLSEDEARAARIIDNKTFMLSDTDTTIEQAEVQSFVDNGGEGAGVFFDFVKASTSDKQPNSTTSPTESKADKVAGSLLTCPKCSHVFLEV